MFTCYRIFKTLIGMVCSSLKSALKFDPLLRAHELLDVVHCMEVNCFFLALIWKLNALNVPPSLVASRLGYSLTFLF